MGCGDREKSLRYITIFLLMLGIALVLLVLNICIGSVNIPLEEVAACFFGTDSDSNVQGIVLQIRFPRALAAVILGGALALAGYLLQTFFRNPIAGPFILGISSGSKLVVALVMIVFMRSAVRVTSGTMIAAAFIGALLSMGFVLLMGKRVAGEASLVISGIMIGYICSAITDFVVTFANDADIVNLHNWSKGSFSGISWNHVGGMIFVVAAAYIGTVLISKPIGAYQLGEVYAHNLGVNIGRLRVALVLLSSLLGACVVAYAGPVSFVGVAVPHITKRLFQTTKPLIMIPACFLGGGIFCLFCDLLARTVLAPTEFSISTVTAVFGAPVVIRIMMEKKAQRG